MKEKELKLEDLKDTIMDTSVVKEVDPIDLKGKKKVDEKNVLFEDAFSSLNNVTDRIKKESEKFLEEKKEYETQEEINSDLEEDIDIEEDTISDSDEEESISVTPNLKTNIRVMEVDTEENEEDDDEDLEKDERDIQFEQLQKELKKKVNPIRKKIDLNSFKISKKPISVSNVLKNTASKVIVADWALFNRNRAISMTEFSGTEINKLNPENSLTNTINTYTNIYTLIYNHIVDANKPKTMEEWLKTVYYKDRNHLYFAIYKASFDRSNYLPYECPHCKHVFVTDDVKIDDMVKYKNDKIKENAKQILEQDTTTEITEIDVVLEQISDNYVFGIKEPSLYEVIFENLTLTDNVRIKYADLLELISYIDSIYLIDHETNELRPVELQVYPNNLAKTVKEKIVKFAKIIESISSDELNTLRAIIAEMDAANADDITYVLPAVTCEKCKKEIEERTMAAENMLFTRHQLAAIANI